VPHYANSIIGVEWYIGTLVIMYLAIPFICKYIDSLEKACIGYVTVLFGCSFINMIADHCIIHVSTGNDLYIYESYIDVFWIFAQLPTMFLGVVLFLLIKNNSFELIMYKKVLACVLTLTSLLMIVGQAYDRNCLYRVSFDCLIAIWLWLLIVAQILHKNMLINNIVFQKIGKYSYPIYLFHMLIIEVYDKAFICATGVLIIDWMIKYMVVFICSCLLSVYLVKYIDRPVKAKLMTLIGE